MAHNVPNIKEVLRSKNFGECRKARTLYTVLGDGLVQFIF